MFPFWSHESGAFSRHNTQRPRRRSHPAGPFDLITRGIGFAGSTRARDARSKLSHGISDGLSVLPHMPTCQIQVIKLVCRCRRWHQDELRLRAAHKPIALATPSFSQIVRLSEILPSRRCDCRQSVRDGSCSSGGVIFLNLLPAKSDHAGRKRAAGQITNPPHGSAHVDEARPASLRSCRRPFA